METTSIYFDCSSSYTNGGHYSDQVSSNGHTTWFTPLLRDEDWEIITGGDYQSISTPTADNGCNGYNPIE